MGHVKDLKTGIKYKNTPIGKIPVDWEVVRLEDICEEIYRYPTYYNIKYVEQDGIPEVRGELIKINGELSNDPSEYRYISKETSANFPRTILHEGDFVLSVRGTMGKIGYISSRLENANMTANLMRISPDRNKVYPLWLKQFLLSDFFQKRLEEASSATTIKTIKAPELKAIELPLPLLSEQKKMAEILTTVDEAIEKTDQIIEKTKETKKGLMQRVLTCGIGHKKFKNTGIGEIPAEWEVVRLDDVGKLKGGTGFPERYQGNNELKYLFIKVSDMNLKGNEVYIKTSKNTINEEIKNIIKCDIFPKNTIIFAKVGAALLLNRRRILARESAIDNNMVGFIIGDRNDPKFYYYILQTIDFAKYVFSGALPSVNQKVLGDICVVSPPLTEQKQIAEILSSVDEEIEKESDHKEQLELLKKGLMQVLLTGKIRVL
jgi:type I restriction enzyme S subunit